VKLPIADINIEHRIRTFFDPKKLDELAESMRTVGLIEPVVVDEDHNLLAGERRIKAAKSLGWTEITTVYLKDLNQWQKKIVELEENLRREELTYVEEVNAKTRIHELYQEKYGKTAPTGGRKGGWKVRDTAEHLGISAGAVSQDLQLARAIKQDPELGKQKTKIAARSMMQRKQTIKARQMLAVLSAVKKPQQEQKSLFPAPVESIQLLHGSSLDIIPTLQDNSIDCLITDPPWQVEYDKEFGSDPQAGLVLTQKVLALLYPKLKSGSLCWMFCATRHLMKGTIYEIVMSCGYRIFEQVLIWYKPHVAHSSHPYRELKNDYEPALFFSKDEPRDLIKPMFAVQEAKLIGQKLHPAQKPTEVLQTLIYNSTVEGETVCDPFMGSGSVCQAAKKTGRKAIGIEKEQEWYDLATGNMR